MLNWFYLFFLFSAFHMVSLPRGSRPRPKARAPRGPILVRLRSSSLNGRVTRHVRHFLSASMIVDHRSIASGCSEKGRERLLSRHRDFYTIACGFIESEALPLNIERTPVNLDCHGPHRVNPKREIRNSSHTS